jgi:transcriptional regulator with XRE-family HTH domain
LGYLSDVLSSPYFRVMKKIADCLGANIRHRRVALGLTQEDLADHVRVSVETVRNIEKGRKWVTTKTVSRFAKALKVSELDLFEDGDKKNWAQVATRVFQLLSKIPPDILDALGETTDWDGIRKVIKIAKRRETPSR